METRYGEHRFYVRRLMRATTHKMEVTAVKAMLYERLPDGKVRCNLCAHRCIIADGKKVSAGYARIAGAPL